MTGCHRRSVATPDPILGEKHMRIPTLDTAARAALTLAAAATVAALPASANAADPVAANDSATTTTGVAKTFNVLANDTADADKTLTVTTTTPTAAHGAVSCTAQGACTYTPTTGWSGTDTFTYGVTDGTATATATASVETVDVRSITIASTPSTTLAWPNSITATTPAPSAKLVGVVKKTGGVVAQGVVVQLMQKPTGASSYTPVGAPQTSDNLGKVSVSGVTPSTFTTYKWKAGNFLGQLSSLSVTPSLTTSFNKTNLALSDTVTVTGTSGPATGGAPVELQRRNAAGNWNLAAASTLGSPDGNGYGAYTFELPANDSGKYIYRVVVPAGNGRVAKASGQTTVKRYDAKVTAVEPANADEFVTVKNIGTVGVNLDKWVLTDGDKSVTLPKWSIGVGDTVKIHSGPGRNTARNLYLKGVDRWAGTGTITLKDKRNIVMDDLVYP
jgi:hypothetical protein